MTKDGANKNWNMRTETWPAGNSSSWVIAECSWHTHFRILRKTQYLFRKNLITFKIEIVIRSHINYRCWSFLPHALIINVVSKSKLRIRLRMHFRDSWRFNFSKKFHRSMWKFSNLQNWKLSISLWKFNYFQYRKLF